MKRFWFLCLICASSGILFSKVDVGAHLILRQYFDTIEHEYPLNIQRVRPYIKFKEYSPFGNGESGEIEGEIEVDVGNQDGTIELKKAFIEWKQDNYWISLSAGFFKRGFWEPSVTGAYKLPCTFRDETSDLLRDKDISGRALGLAFELEPPSELYSLYLQAFETAIPNKKQAILGMELNPLSFVSFRFAADYMPSVMSSENSFDRLAFEFGTELDLGFVEWALYYLNSQDKDSRLAESIDSWLTSILFFAGDFSIGFTYETIDFYYENMSFVTEELEENLFFDLSYYPIDELRLQSGYRLLREDGEKRRNDIVLQAQANF